MWRYCIWLKRVCAYIYIYIIFYTNIQWFHSLSCGLIVTSIGTANFQTQPYFIPARKRIRRLLFEISDTQCLLKVAKVIQFWSNKKNTDWWFGTFFVFPNSWDDDPIWWTHIFQNRSKNEGDPSRAMLRTAKIQCVPNLWSSWWLAIQSA